MGPTRKTVKGINSLEARARSYGHGLWKPPVQLSQLEGSMTQTCEGTVMAMDREEREEELRSGL